MLGRHDAIEEVRAHTGDREIRASLGVPQGPVGLVVVAGARDPRVAEALRARGLATLELEIAAIGELHELASDIVAITERVLARSPASHLPVGYVGADVYAAAAVIAAARRPELVRSVVALGGPIDMAGDTLRGVRAPTLLVTGLDEENLIERDREAIELMTTTTQLAIIPGAFGTWAMLDEVVDVVAEWLLEHFVQALPEPATRRGAWGRQFRDRRAAGERLASVLQHLAGPSTVVCGLSRGGVVVADEIAKSLGTALDVWLVRKIGMPIQPELGMGALAEGAALVLDPVLARWSGASNEDIQQLVHGKADEIRRRAAFYRDDTPAPDIHGKTAVLVDDGIATVGLLRAAVRGARKRGAARVVIAAPVAAAEAVELLKPDVDEVVCLATPQHLISVSGWYQDFRIVTELDVVDVLAAGRVRVAAAA